MPVNTFCLEKSSQVGGWGKEVIVFRAVVDKSKNIAAGVKKLEKCFKRTNSKGLTHSKIYSSLCPSILSHSLPLSLSLSRFYFYILLHSMYLYYYILFLSFNYLFLSLRLPIFLFCFSSLRVLYIFFFCKLRKDWETKPCFEQRNKLYTGDTDANF